MAGEVQFIQYQLWALIGLFLALLVTNVVCYFTRKTGHSPEDERFREMWEKGQLDRLEEEAERFLQEYPNNADALYFGARALVVKRRFPTAKSWLRKLAEISPGLRETITEEIQGIEDLEEEYRG